MGWSSKWGFPQGPMHVSCIPQNGLLGLRRWIQWRVPGLPCNPRAKYTKTMSCFSCSWKLALPYQQKCTLYHVNKNLLRFSKKLHLYTGAILEIIDFLKPRTREQSQGFKTWWFHASEVEGKAEIQRLLICSESPNVFDCAMEWCLDEVLLSKMFLFLING